MYGYQIIIHYKVSYYLFYPHLLPITILELGQHAKFDEWDKKEVGKEQLLIDKN